MPGTLVHGRLHVRPRRAQAPAARSPGETEEAPAWQSIALMFIVVALVAAALISVSFLAAKLATGHAV